MFKNYACQLRPQKTRHLNALNLPQFLSHFRARKPHTLLPLNLRLAPRTSVQDATAVIIYLVDKEVMWFKNIKLVAKSSLSQFIE